MIRIQHRGQGLKEKVLKIIIDSEIGQNFDPNPDMNGRHPSPPTHKSY
jgi:hypothetical protein